MFADISELLTLCRQFLKPDFIKQRLSFPMKFLNLLININNTRQIFSICKTILKPVAVWEMC